MIRINKAFIYKKCIGSILLIGFFMIMEGATTEVLAVLEPDEKDPLKTTMRFQIIKDPSQFPWCINGQVVSTFDNREYRASGILISEYCVLTAAYNICWREELQRIRFADKILFYSGRDGDKVGWESRVVKAIVHPQWSKSESGEEARFNIGIIKLEEPLGEKLGHAEIASRFNRRKNLGKKITLTGYPMIPDHFNQMHMSEGVVQEVEGARFYYDNDTHPGMGGAGILLVNSDFPQCIGIHVYGGSQLNSGIAITKDYANLIEEWVKQMEDPAESHPKSVQSVKSTAEKSLNLEIRDIEEKLQKLKQKKAELLLKQEDIELIENARLTTPEVIDAKKKELNKNKEKASASKRQKLVDAEAIESKVLMVDYVSLESKQDFQEDLNKLQEEIEKTQAELKRQKSLARKQKKLSGLEQPEPSFLPKTKKATLLSLDGGGIRGYMPAIWLDYIYNEIGKRDLHTVFDFIGGTSIGGILSLGLTAPDETQKKAVLTTCQLVELFEVNGERIFPPSSWIKKPFASLNNLFHNQYDATSLEQLLKEHFEEQTLGSLLTHVVVTSVNAEEQKPYNFTTRKESMHPCKLWEVGRATSAAPTYFKSYAFTPPKKSVPIYLLDGGLSRNNPAALVATEAFQLSRDVFNEVLLPDDAVMLSLGTGKVIDYLQVAPPAAGRLKSILPTIETLMNTGSEVVHESVSGLFPHYLRVNPTLERRIELDKVKPANMRYMKNLAEEQFEILDNFIHEDGLRQVLEQGEKRFPKQWQ